MRVDKLFKINKRTLVWLIPILLLPEVITAPANSDSKTDFSEKTGIEYWRAWEENHQAAANKSDSIYYNDLVNERLKSNKRFQKTMKKDNFSALVVDDDGNRLLSINADEKRNPASLSKLMLMYLVLDDIEKGCLSWDEKIEVSGYAAKRTGSNRFMNPYRPKKGALISVKEAFILTRDMSDNTAATVLAERLGGLAFKEKGHKIEREVGYCDIANAMAHKLGMKKSNFVESTGLGYVKNKKRWTPRQYNQTTAEDELTLLMALNKKLQNHGGLKPQKTYHPKGRSKPINNHGKDFVDENSQIVKTGYVSDSGYNIAISEKSDLSDVSIGVYELFESTMNDTFYVIVMGDNKRHFKGKFYRRELSQMLHKNLGKLVGDERLDHEPSMQIMKPFKDVIFN